MYRYTQHTLALPPAGNPPFELPSGQRIAGIIGRAPSSTLGGGYWYVLVEEEVASPDPPVKLARISVFITPVTGIVYELPLAENQRFLGILGVTPGQPDQNRFDILVQIV